jgi:hypothetical protein
MTLDFLSKGFVDQYLHWFQHQTQQLDADDGPLDTFDFYPNNMESIFLGSAIAAFVKSNVQKGNSRKPWSQK